MNSYKLSTEGFVPEKRKKEMLHLFNSVSSTFQPPNKCVPSLYIFNSEFKMLNEIKI